MVLSFVDTLPIIIKQQQQTRNKAYAEKIILQAAITKNHAWALLFYSSGEPNQDTRRMKKLQMHCHLCLSCISKGGMRINPVQLYY